MRLQTRACDEHCMRAPEAVRRGEVTLSSETAEDSHSGSAGAVVWESWRWANSTVGELWEMFTMRKPQGGPVIKSHFKLANLRSAMLALLLPPQQLPFSEALFYLGHDDWQLWDCRLAVMTGPLWLIAPVTLWSDWSMCLSHHASVWCCIHKETINQTHAVK